MTKGKEHMSVEEIDRQITELVEMKSNILAESKET